MLVIHVQQSKLTQYKYCSMKNNKSFLILIMLLATISLQAQNTYYVSLTGNDSNDGLTETTSWRTIAYAVSSSSPVSAGDTVYIKAGDYGQEDIFIDKNYLPSDARISFIGYQNVPGDLTSFDFGYGDNVDASLMPLINPNDRTVGEGINIEDSYNITIKNIQIANCLGGVSIWNTNAINSNIILENIFLQNIGWDYSTAIAIKEGNNNIISNCLIVNATGAGMDIWGNGNQISNCKIYSDESQQIPDGTYTSMDYYIVIKGNNNIVSNSYAERVGDIEDVGHGFEIKESGENNLFENCTVKNMIAGCFSVRWEAVQNNEFRNCIALGGVSSDVTAFMIREGASHNTFNNCTSDGCNAGISFILAGEDANYCGSDNTFNNCVIKNADWVIDLNPYFYNSATVDNNLLMNCTINNANYLFNCERPNTGNRFVNCIISNVTDFLTGSNNSTFTYQYCDFHNNGFTTPTGIGNISSDPLFVNQYVADYHLQANSPCVDTGTSLNAPATDFEGITRPQGSGFDIGAYEYSSGAGIDEQIQNNLTVYPNPTNDIIYIPEQYNQAIYKIYSISGQLVNIGMINKQEINLSKLTAGIYILKIYDIKTNIEEQTEIIKQ